MRHSLTARGSGSGSPTACVAGLQTQDSPYRNPAASCEQSRISLGNSNNRKDALDPRIAVVGKPILMTEFAERFRHTKLCEVKTGSPQETGKILE